MKVKIPIEFEVEPVDVEEGDEMSEGNARDAADLAAWHHICFAEHTGTSHMREEEVVEVHVDGFGKCRVRLAQ